jgi:hypothetical protein
VYGQIFRNAFEASCIFGVSVLYSLNYRSEDIETSYMGAVEPTLHSTIEASCLFTYTGHCLK